MTDELDARYFSWLHAQVVHEVAPTPSQSYFDLLGILHATEFVWLIPGDDNRAEYGKGLRIHFVHDVPVHYTDDWMHQPCSVLEMLIALAMEAEFDTDIPSTDWFWRFMRTLGLAEMSDATNVDAHKVSSIVDRLIWRTYDTNGHGGLFPLRHPKQNQREVEIWYQFCAYVIEGAMI